MQDECPTIQTPHMDPGLMPNLVNSKMHYYSKTKTKKKSIIKSGVEFVNTFSFAMIFYNSVNNDTC